jgi:hypothetical protein
MLLNDYLGNIKLILDLNFMRSIFYKIDKNIFHTSFPDDLSAAAGTGFLPIAAVY